VTEVISVKEKDAAIWLTHRTLIEPIEVLMEEIHPCVVAQFRQILFSSC